MQHLRKIESQHQAAPVADAFSGLVESLAKAVGERARDILLEDLEVHREQLRREDDLKGISPFAPGKTYFSYKELCERWGMGKSAVYEIPETELPITYLGPNKGSRRYLALHVYRYEQLLTKTECDYAIQNQKQSLLESA